MESYIYIYICTWSIYIYLVDELLAVNDCERNHNRFVRVCKPEFLSSKFGGFAAIPAVFPTKFSSFNPKVDLRFSEQIYYASRTPTSFFESCFNASKWKKTCEEFWKICPIILKKTLRSWGPLKTPRFGFWVFPSKIEWDKKIPTPPDSFCKVASVAMRYSGLL